MQKGMTHLLMFNAKVMKLVVHAAVARVMARRRQEAVGRAMVCSLWPIGATQRRYGDIANVGARGEFTCMGYRS